MAFKYDSELQRLACNLTAFTAKMGRNAFCWAFDPITDSRNFVPRAIAIKNDTCGGWALSFFETEKQAKTKLQKLMVKTPNIYLKLGTHIANGTLNKGTGVSEACNSEGHFNHHEYAGNDFKTTFAIIGSSHL